MSKTFFQPGTPITSAFLNAISTPNFVANPDADGEFSLITDSDMSTAPGDIIARYSSFIDAFDLLPQTTAGEVTVRGGVIHDTNLQIVAVPDTVVNLPNTGTTSIYLDDAGIQVGTFVPSAAILLWTVTTTDSPANGTVSSSIDNRFNVRYTIQQRPILVNGIGRNGTTDFTADGSTPLNGTIVCRNFIIPDSTTVTVYGQVSIFCSGTCDIGDNVTINADRYATGGVDQNVGSSGASNSFLGAGQKGQGLGSAGAFGRGRGYDYTNLLSSGGGQGRVGTIDAQGFTGAGGDGGITIFIEAAGPIAIGENVSVDLSGSDATDPQYGISATPNFQFLASGGGGGTGGLFWGRSATSITIGSGTVIDISGGNGANGIIVSSTPADRTTRGGGGGSGGYAVFESPAFSSGATIIDTGGTRGNNAVSGNGATSFAGVGGAGFAGDGGESGGGILDAAADGITLILTRIPI